MKGMPQDEFSKIKNVIQYLKAARKISQEIWGFDSVEEIMVHDSFYPIVRWTWESREAELALSFYKGYAGLSLSIDGSHPMEYMHSTKIENFMRYFEYAYKDIRNAQEYPNE